MVRMKTIFALLALSIARTIAADIEPIEQDAAGKIARKILAEYGSPADAPFPGELDTQKVAGIKGGEAGLIVIPDKKLTAELLSAVTEKPTPIGQLWMHKVVPSINGTAAAASKLRTVKIGGDEGSKSVEVYYLTVSKNTTGALELALTAVEKEPLVKVALVKTDAASSSAPMAVNAHKEGENSGILVLSVFGSYKADIQITKATE
jgi:hypothetical protein